MEGSSHHDIGELLSAQRGIESDKITERKKWSATLRGLLDSDYIIDIIESHSSSDARPKFRGPAFSWSTLFKSVMGYVSREVEAIAKLSEKPGSAYSSRLTKKKDVGEMFRAYVRACNKRGPHLPLQEVLEHICSVLGSRRKLGWLGMDYSQVLLNYILSVPHYVLQTTARQWDALTSLYCDMFLEPHPSFDRTLLARMIHTLVCQSSSQCDLHSSKLYLFFTKALSNISHEKNPKVLEHLLASLNGFSRAVAPNARGRLCTLGETIFPALLHFWAKSQPAVKEQVVEFLRVQLSVHHPLGAHTDEEGAWASNDVTWNRNLEKLYDQIISDFESASRKVRWSGKSESSHKPEVIELASDVIHQVMYLRDVRNPSPEAVPPRGKRRKSLTVWMSLREGLDSSEDGPSAVLWLQLLTCLLSKWPRSLPPEDGAPLLSLLHKVQLETKRVECVQWVFMCLRALASLHVAPPTAMPTSDLWSKVWASTLKTVSVHTAEEQGYALLTTLLQRQLTDCDLEPWKVLSAAANPPTRPLVSFLAAILCNHTLPESFQSSWTTPTATPSNDYPLRSQLLHFLLPTSTEGRVDGRGAGEGGGGGAVNGFQSGSIKTESSPPVGLMAHTLVALTQRSCSSAKLPYLVKLDTEESPTCPVPVLAETANREEWTRTEHLFLDSTFDTAISLPDPGSSDTATVTMSRETPIGALKTLLLDLLCQRAELLSQPIEIEGSSPARDRAHQLSQLLSLQAHHCSLTLHCLLLLCHCEVFPQAEQLRRTPLIKTLPDLLHRISVALRDPLWSDVEKPLYYEVATSVLTSLGPLVNFSPLGGCQLAPLVGRALQVVRRVCQLSFPTDLLDTIFKLARGKWPLPSATPSTVSSNFSLGGSSASGSRPHSTASAADSVSPAGEEFTDLSMPDSDLSLQSDTGLTCVTGMADILSPSALNAKTTCQLEAAQLLCGWYRNTVAVQGESAVRDGTAPPGGGEDFDPQKAIVSMLSKECLDLSQGSSVQLALKSCSSLASSRDQLRPEILECVLDVLGRVLTSHRKSQGVYCKSLRVLAALAWHFGAAADGGQARERCTSLLSAFWTLYSDGSLHARVRLELAKAVHAFFQADPTRQWCSVSAKKKTLDLRSAVVRMVNDQDHSVRMYMARAVSSLYREGKGVWSLLPRPEQEEAFQQVSEMLKKAHMVQTSQDDISAEDESVNRVSSMISTLLCEAGTSPTCERKVVSILATAVGQGHIDLDLVCKALSRLAAFLGYPSRRHLLEDMLVSLLKSWLKDGFAVTELPHQLWEFDNRDAFFRAYAPRLAPYLVSCCDEAQLESLASLVATPLSSLLTSCLPACLVFILPSYARQGSGDSEELSQERRSRASASHNLLTSLLSEEVVAATIQSSMDEFVVQLLLQMYEPHTADTHLAKYCRSCDPEPCPPHYSSVAVRATLDYMPSCYGKAVGTHFIRLLSKSKDHIQKVLLSLALKIEATHRPFQKRRLFLAYNLFVSLVCKELGEGLEETQAFVLRDIVHTIVRVLAVPEGKDREGVVRELFAPCCDTLLAVCKTAVEACPQELAHHLHTIVATLIPFAQRQTAEGTQALTVITYLVLKAESEVLAEHVAQLDPFPDGELFAKLRQKQMELREIMGMESLEQELDRFLSVSPECPVSSRREGLKYLQQLLRSSRLGMAELLRWSGSPVLRLIQGLVRLCQGAGEGVEGEGGVWVEVARCLGEIGPTDLRCIALPASREPHGLDISALPSGWSHCTCYCARILSLLTAMLIDKDITVVQASAKCLRAVLATKNGATVLNKIEEQLLGGDWSVYLEPFKQQKKKKSPSTTSHPPTLPSPASFPALVDVADLWIPSGGVTHGNWITRLVTTLMDSGGVTDEVLLLLKPVCQVKVSLCEQTFPLLLYNILVAGREDYRSILSHQVQAFFSSVGPTHGSTHRLGGVHPDSVRTMLDMVMYLRTVDRAKKSTPWENNFWLDLNFLDVATAAQHCSAYFTSLLYIEIWHGATSDASRLNPSTNNSIEAMEVDHTHPVEQTSCLDNPAVQSLLLEAYSRIGEPDGLHGTCAAHVADEDTMTRMYEQEGQWQKSLSAYNLQLQLPGAACHSKLVESLQQLGLTHVLHAYLSGVGTASPQQSQELAEYRFQAAWRTSLWEESCLHVASRSGGYHQSIYSCLTALKDGELGLLQSSLVEARSEVIRNLCSSGQESSSGVYPSLGRLLSLLELEEAGNSADLRFLADWKQRMPYMDSDFQFVEPVLALRSSVLHGLLVRSSHEGSSEQGGELPVEIRRKREGLFAALTETLLNQARMAREAGRYQVAEGALFALRHLDERRGTFNIPAGLQPSLHWSLQLERAELHWERGEGPLAMGILKTLLQQLGAGGDPVSAHLASLRPTALCLYGSWLAESHSKNPVVVMETYLEESVRLLEALPPGDNAPLLRAYLTLARYADSQYQRITRHMSSATFETKRQLLQKSKLDLEKLTSHLSEDAILRDRHLRILRRQSEEDEITMFNLRQDRQQFLGKALKNYLLCLKTGDNHDLRVFRLCALWFANCTNSAVKALVSEGVALLESRKFLPLMYQLAARMSAQATPTDPFQQTLQQIIYRTTLEHPHHCLYVILALSNATKDNRYPMSGHVSGARATKATTGRLARKTSNVGTVDEDKVKAAVSLLSRLRSEKPSLVGAMERLCEAYIDLAYHDVSAFKKQRRPIKLPSGCPLLKLARMKEVAMPTMEIEVDPTCRYDNIVYIEGFDSCFQLAGGVNLPKILSCQGSDGNRRRQLVKGRDDLRQDAVMQQVFLLVNRLLRKEPATIKRKLSIRTYKVVPLSQRSGIVEWCEGTRPLGEYLIATPQSPYQGAHHRYQPGDWSSFECRKKLDAAGKDRKGSKYNAYLEICAHFQPVFHHFFMEYFPTPSEWFERRLAYTRSVAASSIVGYIVGLGDRHVQNILIDTKTAEFIHIDLGVAFEQGKTLPTPETVPFRLTRDMVDGMGVEGVEGVFRRSCEETLVVMRGSHEELRTIVEVLLYDPLYLWTISPLKAFTIQRRADGDDTSVSTTSGEQIFEGEQTNRTANGSSSSSNKMAERVLLRLQEKLEGIEDGVPLSVSGQVNHLIQEATDTANLCLLFAGWQPWI